MEKTWLGTWSNKNKVKYSKHKARVKELEKILDKNNQVKMKKQSYLDNQNIVNDCKLKRIDRWIDLDYDKQ